MQGLEILTTTQIATNYSFNIGVFWTVAICILIIFVIIGIAEDEILGSSIVGIIVGLLTGMISSVIVSEPIDYETRYKVMVTDEVSMSEFLEQYEIIDQDGKILTIREKRGE